MAHHTSTPGAVLNAPARTFSPLVAHQGAARAERRQGITIPAALGHHAAAAYLRRLAAAGRNEPFVSTVVRRGRKVRRNGAPR